MKNTSVWCERPYFFHKKLKISRIEIQLCEVPDLVSMSVINISTFHKTLDDNLRRQTLPLNTEEIYLALDTNWRPKQNYKILMCDLIDQYMIATDNELQSALIKLLYKGLDWPNICIKKVFSYVGSYVADGLINHVRNFCVKIGKQITVTDTYLFRVWFKFVSSNKNNMSQNLLGAICGNRSLCEHFRPIIDSLVGEMTENGYCSRLGHYHITHLVNFTLICLDYQPTYNMKVLIYPYNFRCVIDLPFDSFIAYVRQDDVKIRLLEFLLGTSFCFDPLQKVTKNNIAWLLSTTCMNEKAADLYKRGIKNISIVNLMPANYKYILHPMTLYCADKKSRMIYTQAKYRENQQVIFDLAAEYYRLDFHDRPIIVEKIHDLLS